MSEPTPFVDVPAAVRLAKDIVEVSGPDAVSYLQGQLSQDLDAVADGGVAWSFLLEPQGHVVALARVVRAGERVLLVVDDGLGGAVVERLERFKLRVKADVGVADAAVWAVRGPGARAEAGPNHLVVDAPDGGGCDVIGPAAAPPGGLPEVPAVWYDARRIEAGLPVIGRDVPAGAIPAETGMVDVAVSFTKGCYTGQELVARVDSRGGRAPRRLVLVTSDERLEEGARLVVGGEAVGEVTSVVGPPIRPRWIGLARVKRAVEVPGEATVADGGGVARLEAAPLVS